MFHLESFWYRPYRDTKPPTEFEGESVGECILVWIQSEIGDEEKKASVLRKMLKNIRWLIGKAGCSHIILHSFAHIGESKASPEFTDALILELAQRLRDRDFLVHVLPSGLNEFKMHVKGPSLAKVFKRIT